MSPSRFSYKFLSGFSPLFISELDPLKDWKATDYFPRTMPHALGLESPSF